MEHTLHAQLLLNEVAEGTAVVVVAVAHQIGLSVGHLILADGGKDGTDEVAHIDKREHLPLVAHRKVDVLLDALRHHEVVLLARTIHTRGAEEGVVKPPVGLVALLGQELLALHLAFAVCRVGLWCVVGSHVVVGAVGIHLLADGTQHTQAAHIEELLGQHVQFVERVDEVVSAVVVVQKELLAVQTLRRSCRMDDDIPTPHLFLIFSQPLAQSVSIRQVEKSEVESLLLQPSAA